MARAAVYVQSARESEAAGEADAGETPAERGDEADPGLRGLRILARADEEHRGARDSDDTATHFPAARELAAFARGNGRVDVHAAGREQRRGNFAVPSEVRPCRGACRASLAPVRLGDLPPTVRKSADEADRVAYARDLWPRHHLAVRAGHVAPAKPAAIVWPESTEQVAEVVRAARARGVPVVPYGAGSGVCAGVLPRPDAVVLDLKRMTRWRRLDAEVPSLEVEAGHMGLPLEEGLGRRGLTLGHFPSSILCSTVGGWIAARSAGQCSGLYGKIEDMVLELECVTGAGEIVRLPARAHGPSLVPLVVGSEGTLAVITAATLRLHRAPEQRAFAAWSLPTMKDGWESMRELFQAGLRPPVARLYDPFDAMLARQGRAKKDTVGGAPGLGTSALRSVLRRPKLLNLLLDTQAAGKAMGGALLVTIFEGAEAVRDAEEARRILARRGAKDEGEEPARRWHAHRYSVSYRQAPLVARGLFVDTMEVAARWSRLEALYDGVRHALAPRAFVMAHMSHAYPDGCCIYFSFAGSAGSGAAWDEACEAQYDAAWKAALDAAVDAGGTIAHHHGVGRSKAPRMDRELGAGVSVFRALKRAFDPAGILNPGALVPPPSPDPYAPRAGTEEHA